MGKPVKRGHNEISKDKKSAAETKDKKSAAETEVKKSPAQNKSRTRYVAPAPSGNCAGCSSTNSDQICPNAVAAAVDLQFGFQGNSFGFGLQTMMQDPFLTAFTDMTLENSFAPSWPSSTPRGPMSMTLTPNWGSNIPKTFQMPNISYNLLNRSTLPSVTPNGLLLSSPYDAQNPHGINFPTSWDNADLVNNLLTVWPTGQEFGSRSEFERAMESVVSFGLLPTANQTVSGNVAPAVTTKSDYTVVNDGFYSTTTENETDEPDDAAGVGVEPRVVSDSEDDKNASDTEADSDADSGAETKSRRKSRKNGSRSQTRKRKNCESGKCPLSRDGRRRKRRSGSASARNRRSKSAKQSGGRRRVSRRSKSARQASGRRRVSRRSKSVQSRRRRSSKKTTGGKRRRSRR